MITTIQTSVDVDVPVRTAYDQWTQFEDFPQFMDAVLDVQQIDDRHLRWTTQVGGISREFISEITEQSPDQRIAWTSIEGPSQGGVVTFHQLSDHTTRIMYQMDFEPEGAVETAGAVTGTVKRQVQKDLERFKKFIENRGEPTGAWRGEIENDEV